MKTIITNNTATRADTIDAVFDTFKAIDVKVEIAVRRELVKMESENMLLQFLADLVQNDPEFKAKYVAFRAAKKMGVK